MNLQEQLKCGDVVLMDVFPAAHGDHVQATLNRNAIMRHYVQYGLEGGFTAPLVGLFEAAEAPIGLFATAAALTTAENDGPDPVLSATFPQHA